MPDDVQDSRSFPSSPSAWLRRALEVVARAEPRHVVCEGEQRWAARSLHKTQDPANRYPLGLHHHSHPEVCIALAGRGRIEVGGRSYALVPPRISVLPADVVHSEGFERPDRRYTVLWLLPIPPSSWKLWLLQYQTDGRWNMRSSWMLNSRHGRNLFDLLSKHGPTSPATLEAIRPSLVMLLAEALDLQVAKPASHRTYDTGELHRQIVEQVRALLDNNLSRAIRVDELGDFLHLSPDYVNRLFTRSVGQTIHRYHLHRRMEAAMKLLRGGGLMVKNVAYQVGFTDPLYFSRAFRKRHGVWPTEV